MFMSKHTASQMRWHFDKRVDEYGVMRHPTDSIAWKEFDRMYPEFAQEPRNIRLGLATDGFNPFGSMSTSYSMWPVVVVPYNLPPWMCMKQQYSIMTLLIPGPKAPGKDIDVYLRPLIDELKELWEGVPTYDKFTDSGFKMRATVIWTINDFPAYGNLSGWSTKGYLACPVCLEDTSHTKLRNKIYLDRLEVDIVFILCKLEKIFPPAFFDVMVHLAVHLPHEAKLAGPVGYRWMYPIERYCLFFLKGYVRNRARPEGSIVEGYISNESLTFCSMYLRNGEIISSHHERNNDGGEINAKLSVFVNNARPCGGYKMVQWSELEMESAYWYILDNCDEVEPFKNEFLQLLQIESPDNLEQRQRKLFPQWLKTRVKTLSKQGLGVATNELYALAYGPDKRVGLYTGCVVNGVRWHVKHIEETRTTQNSGVMVPGTHGDQQSNFYGRLVNVVKIGFQDGYHVILFKCEWFNTQPRFFRKKKIHRILRDYHLTSLNITNVWYKDDPYVPAKQAQQIFYLDDPKLGSGWKVIQKIRHRHVWDVPENEAAHEVETIYDEGIDQDGDDIVITSRDENDLPSTSLRRDDAEPEIVEEEISLEPIEVDDYEEDFTDDDPIEEQLSGDESNSVHSDDYSDLD
ncbi:unnamed protein product [Prunus brigantina]